MFLALNASFMLVTGVQRQLFFSGHIPGVQRQNVACFWHSAPEWCSVLALNASQMHLTGVERQPMRPPECENFFLLFLTLFLIFFVTPHDHVPN